MKKLPAILLLLSLAANGGSTFSYDNLGKFKSKRANGK